MFDTLPVDKIGVTNTRLTNLEYLGTDMIEAGNEFGPGTPYGSALIRVGQTEQALGEIEKEYIKGSHVAFCGPLHTFLDGEMKNIMRERKILENRRLDLDSCKGKVRKARAMQLQPAVSSEVRKFFLFKNINPFISFTLNMIKQKDGIDPRVLLDTVSHGFIAVFLKSKLIIDIYCLPLS